MNRTGSLYIEKDSVIHSLQGSVKLIMMICWTIFIFMFMDARVFTAMLFLGAFLIYLARLPFKRIRPLLLFVIIFTIFNSLILILVTPLYGSELSGTYTTAVKLGVWSLTWETVFFALTLSLKYLSILPITLLFVFTTHPSRFASNLNKLGIPYRVAYAVSIALRYIPDVAEEMTNIKNAQEARGVSFDKRDAGPVKRLKNYGTILVPLMLSSLNRVEVVSNAMDLRGFGRHSKRTWFYSQPYKATDFVFIGLSILLVAVGLVLKNTVLTSYWYPFT